MYEDLKEQFKQLETQLSDPELSKNNAEMIKLARQHSSLKELITFINEEERLEREIEESKVLLNSSEEAEMKAFAEQELKDLELKLTDIKEKIEEARHPQGPNDHKNAIIEIRAGAGGDEAALFAGDLFKMYIRFCERQGWKMK